MLLMIPEDLATYTKALHNTFSLATAALYISQVLNIRIAFDHPLPEHYTSFNTLLEYI
jgi:hypothetical protein